MNAEPMVFPINLEIIEIVTETANTRTFILKSPIKINYQAGQYLSFLADKDDWKEVRSYSISSIPTEPYISITVKRQDNGLMSRQLIDHANIGDTITAVSLGGKFTLPIDLSIPSDFVFFAAGSGIVPIFSLIKALLSQSTDNHLTLIYSNSSPENTIFYKTLSELASTHSERFKIVFFFSNAEKILQARLSAFQIEDLVLQHIRSKIHEAYFYICGPIDYMDTVQITLLTHGATATHVYTEEYFFYTESLEESLIPPPDQHAYPVTILDKNITIDVQYPNSILHTALDQHILLPHSCSSGQCGNCVAKIISGKVWMSYNSVLTAEEIASGLTLTCQGFPIEGPVTISYSEI